MNARLKLTALLAVALVGCQFETNLPDAAVTCTSRSDCPGNSVCRLPIGLCVPSGEHTQPPAFTVPPSAEPALARVGTTVRLRFSLDADLQAVPEILAALPEGSTVAFVTQNGPNDRDFEYTATVADGSAEGIVAIGVRASDLYGNELFEPQTEARFIIDTTAPHASVAAIGYVSPPTLSVLALTALNVDGRLLVSFTASEKTSTPPTLRAEPDVVVFTPRPATEGTVSFEGVLRAGTTGHGPLQLFTRLRDLVGNEADVALQPSAPVQFDVETPLFLTDAGLLHVRNPTGSPSSGGRVVFEVRGAPGSAEPGALVRAFTENGVTQIGATHSDDAGGFVVELSPPDRAAVWVDVVDEAGNRAPLAVVRDVEFTAVPTVGTSATGTTSPMLQRRDRLIDPLAALKSPDGVAVELQGEGSWRQRPSLRLINTTTPALAWNPVGARLVSWGTGVVSSFDGVDGKPIGAGTPVLPSPAMTFDRRRGTLVVFGGAGSAEHYESIDGEVWNQVQFSQGPNGREGHVLVFDGQNVQLLGGRDPLNPDGGGGDFYSWNGVDWSIVDAGTMPRTLVAAAWNSASDVVTALASDHGEAPQTWQFTRARGWHLVAAASPATPPEANGPMVYDTFAHRVRFNANQSDGGAQLWAFADAGWSLEGPSVPMPGQAVSAFDEVRGQWVANTAPFGGNTRYVAFCALGDAGWQELNIRQGPPSSRNDHAAIWDSQSQSMIATGGVTVFGVLPGDTVSYLGPLWQTINAGSARLTYGHSFTATPQGRFLFGGTGNENSTWQLDSQFHWALVADGGIPGRTLHAAVAAPAGLAIFGGTTSDTSMWLFDGGVWAPYASAAALLPRQGMSVVNEPITNTMMCFGGAPTSAPLPTMTGAVDGTLNDNALFIGGPFSWRQVPTSLAPRRQHTAVVDPDRDEVLLFGGINRLGNAMNELELIRFERDGGVHVDVPAVSDPEGDLEPTGRWGHTAVFDPIRHVMQVYAGMDQFSVGGNVRNADLWEYRVFGQKPSLSSAIDSSALELSGVDAVTLTINVKAGATGYRTDGSAVDGFAVDVFIEGRWQEVGRVNAAAVNAPVNASFSVGPLAPSAIATTLQRMAVRITPLGANARLNAHLSVDALELQVRFVRPD